MGVRTPISAAVGPAEVALGRAYVHDVELDGDEQLAISMLVEVRDDAGRVFAATVTDRSGSRWQVTIRS
jgi:hypothetical protein